MNQRVRPPTLPVLLSGASLLFAAAFAAGCAPYAVMQPRDEPAGVYARATEPRPGAPTNAEPLGEPLGQPPPEVFEACRDHVANDACSVNLGQRALEGTCGTSLDDTRLACRASSSPIGRFPGSPLGMGT